MVSDCKIDVLEEADKRFLTLLRQTLTASIYPESSWKILRADDYKGIRGIAKKSIVEQFARRNYLVIAKRPYNSAGREAGADWPMIGYSMIGHRRLENIENCLSSVVKGDVKGDFVECGVWRGGASIYAKAVLSVLGATDRKVWLADSFEGLPVQSEEDKEDPALVGHSYLAVSMEEVKDNFGRFGLLDDRVQFLKGWFCDTLKASPISQVAVLELDGDYYSSTMDGLDGLYDRVSQGGYIIIDDYHDFVSCRKAVTEFLRSREIVPELKSIDGHGVFWRKE